MASVGGGVRKDSVFFKGLATGLLTMLQRVHGLHSLDLVYFFFFCLFFLPSCGGGPRVGWEDWETSVIDVRCMKFPDNYQKYHDGGRGNSTQYSDQGAVSNPNT